MFKLKCATQVRALNCLWNCISFSNVATAATIAQKKPILLAEDLPNRNLLRLHGKDVLPALQRLVTNDVTRLRKGQQAVYSMFLNKNGKVLADSILYRTANKDTFLLECDHLIRNDLMRHMRIYKKRNMKFDVESLSGDFAVWAVFNDCSNTYNNSDPLSYAYYKTGGSIGMKITSQNSIIPKVDDIGEEVILCRDPRLQSLGTRIIVPSDFTMKDLARLFPHCLLEAPDSKNGYKQLRYKLGIGEGVEDHTPGKILPVEANCDFLNGLCSKKLSYLGYDGLTQSTYSKGCRKRLMPVVIDGRVDFTNFSVHLPNGRHIGKLVARKGKNGLALLRVEEALDALRLMIDGVPCELKKPSWWSVNMFKRDASAKESLARAVG